MRSPTPTAERHPVISAVIISRNEADVIEHCLLSVVPWVDETIVVDMMSADGTREIAQRYATRLVDHEPLTYVEPARNFALSLARGDWIIMLDPDERVPASLADELQRIARRDDVDVVVIPFRRRMFGTPVQSRGASDIAHPRFFRGGALSWPSHVHGHPELTGLRCYQIPASTAEMAIQHDTWRSVSMVLDKIQRYSPRAVDHARAQGRTFSLSGMLRTAQRGFCSRMVNGHVYEDGMAGFLTALFYAISDLTDYAQLWEAEGRPPEWDRAIVVWGRRLARVYRVLRWIARPRRTITRMALRARARVMSR